MVLNIDYDQPESSTSEVDRKFWEYFDNPITPGYNESQVEEQWGNRDQGAVLATYGALMAVGGVGNVAVLVALTRARRRRSRVDLLMTHLAIADVAVTTGVIPLEGAVLATYGAVMAVGGVGNVAVLVALTRARRRRSRVDLLMTHLAIADVAVTTDVNPLEIGWKYTNAWLAGNLLCKLLLVLRAFGLYLSSNVLVCISIDRFFAVIYPLRLPVARRRSKQMLYCAWAVALACSLPQSIVFRVKRHPSVAGFEQCVSFDAFSTTRHEVAYNVFCLCAMYFVPLLVITACYLCIACEIHSSSRELDDKCTHRNGAGPVRLRRSDRRVLERARRRTLRMTVTIVAVFALCWLPYATMAMWYMIDRSSARRVSPRVQDLLFAMAVSNSCMNPLVYGSYTLNLRAALRRLLHKACCPTHKHNDILGNSGSSSIKNRNNNMETPLMTPVKSSSRVRTRLGVRFAETSLTVLPERIDPPRSARAPA